MIKVGDIVRIKRLMPGSDITGLALLADMELIEAAPEPFRVGHELIEEMGEPPVGSIISHHNYAYQRFEDGWYGLTWLTTRSVRYWPDFKAGGRVVNTVLLHLGDGTEP